MAGLPIIYEALEIMDEGGALGSGTTYNLTDQENLEVNIEEVTTLVEDGQTIMDALDGNFNVLIYDETVMNDTHVQTGSTIPARAKIALLGAAGAATTTMDGVIIRAYKDWQTGNRVGFRVQASIRSTTTPFAES